MTRGRTVQHLSIETDGSPASLRAALALLKRKEQLLDPLAQALADAGARVRPCSNCGALDAQDPCAVCSDQRRDRGLICVVEEVGAAVTWFRPGDQVYGYIRRHHLQHGTYAELATAPDGFAKAAEYLSKGIFV